MDDSEVERRNHQIQHPGNAEGPRYPEGPDNVLHHSEATWMSTRLSHANHERTCICRGRWKVGAITSAWRQFAYVHISKAPPQTLPGPWSQAFHLTDSY
jgi:hypothetical protein